MLLRAYSIFDCKALQYHQPWYAVSDGVACRMLQDLVNDPQTMLGRHPKDYTLYFVGIWNDLKGEWEAVSPKVHVIDAVALVARVEQPGLFPEPEGQGVKGNGEFPPIDLPGR